MEVGESRHSLDWTPSAGPRALDNERWSCPLPHRRHISDRHQTPCDPPTAHPLTPARPVCASWSVSEFPRYTAIPSPHSKPTHVHLPCCCPVRDAGRANAQGRVQNDPPAPHSMARLRCVLHGQMRGYMPARSLHGQMFGSAPTSSLHCVLALREHLRDHRLPLHHVQLLPALLVGLERRLRSKGSLSSLDPAAFPPAF